MPYKNVARWKSFVHRWIKFYFYIDDDDDDDDEDDEKKGLFEF
jgi:hypothetical protein